MYFLDDVVTILATEFPFDVVTNDHIELEATLTTNKDFPYKSINFKLTIHLHLKEEVMTMTIAHLFGDDGEFATTYMAMSVEGARGIITQIVKKHIKSSSAILYD